MPTHIIIEDEEPRIVYTASAQTNFTIPFPFFAFTDIQVWVGEDEAEYDATPSDDMHFSVSGVAVDGGYSSGTVTFGAPVTGQVIVSRNVPAERTTDFPYPSPTIDIRELNTQVDRIFAILQQNQRDLNRSLSLGTDDIFTARNIRIKNLADPIGDLNAANKQYVDGMAGIIADQVSADASAAAASASAAATSASAASTSATNASSSATTASSAATAAGSFASLAGTASSNAASSASAAETSAENADAAAQDAVRGAEFHNGVLNGDFNQWRRGTSTALGAGVTGLITEAWLGYSAAGGTYSRSTDAPNRSQYSLEVPAAGQISQRIEADTARQYPGRTITITVQIKVLSGTTNFTCEISSANSVDNFSAVTLRDSAVIATGVSAGSFVTYEATFTNVAAEIANGMLLKFIPSTGATYRIGAIRVEIQDGSVTYVRRRRQLEELFCQRRLLAAGNAPYEVTGTRTLAIGYAHSSTTARFVIRTPVPLRIIPSLMVSDPSHFRLVIAGGTMITPTSITMASVSNNIDPSIIVTVASGLTDGDAVRLEAVDDAAALLFDAELT
jgi:hypothetical protein